MKKHRLAGGMAWPVRYVPVQYEERREDPVVLVVGDLELDSFDMCRLAVEYNGYT